METLLVGLGAIERAWRAQAPELSELVCALARSDDPQQPSRPDAPTWRSVRQQHRGQAFRKLDLEQRRQRRIADWRALEAPDAPQPLPERLRLHGLLLELYQDGSAYARQQLLRIIADIPLRYGPWRGLKRIFKEAEARSDWEIYGALAARLDTERPQPGRHRDVDAATLDYLVRRAWRSLRQLGQRLPAAYPDAASEILRHYPPHTRFEQTWIANQIFFHEDAARSAAGRSHRAYTRSAFRRTHYQAGQPSLQYLAFPEAWRRSPRPLFGLLERAASETVRAFAAEALKTGFRTQLREAEPDWVVRLIGVGSPSVDRFVVWLLDNVPRFEPSTFRKLGQRSGVDLHSAVLSLLGSPDAQAATWAAGYARTHARDLPLSLAAHGGIFGATSGVPVALLPLANSPHEAVRALARDLLRDKEPRAGVGLDAWGELLGTPYGHAIAAKAIGEHFSARELTLDWFRERLLSDKPQVVTFARELLPRIHPERSVPTSFWASILDDPQAAHLGTAALDALQGRPLDGIEPDVLRRALLHPGARSRLMAWVREGRIEPGVLGVDWLKALAYQRTWEASPWVQELLGSGRAWASELKFDDVLSSWALELLGDERNFSGRALGFHWLFELVQRVVPRYHRFAAEVLTRSFVPDDFPGGAEGLWERLISPGAADEPLRRFALHYLKLHHPDLHEAETEHPLAPEAALPQSFLTFERAFALCADNRAPLRELGLLWLKWEFARMSPPMEQIALLAELPWPEVRAFVALALTADDSLVHRRYRIDPAALSVPGVYRFVESLDGSTRALGMKLISLHERLSVPEELFRLTESPDRVVRAFVVRQLWRLYRERGTSDAFQPRPLEDRALAPRPAPRERRWPAGAEEIRAFLRRTLFGLPPTRERSLGDASEAAPRLRPLPARLAKIALIEVCRDLAVEDRDFAALIAPVLEEFLRSRGASESKACLVALTRIRHRWGEPVCATSPSAS